MKDAIARLHFPGGSGTAWLCSREYALTAAHRVEARQNVSPNREIPLGSPCSPSCITLDFPWKKDDRLAVSEIVRFDLGLDAAMLRLSAGVVPEYVRPVPVGVLPKLKPWPSGPAAIRWTADGFPRAHGEGLRLTGAIDDPESRVGQFPAIQMLCDQGGLGELNGASGAAVVCEGVAVGLIRYGTLMQKVIFATTVLELAGKFPEIGDVLNSLAPAAGWAQKVTAPRPPLSPRARALWKERREFLEQQLAITADWAQKFALIQQIAETDEHLQGELTPPAALTVWKEKLDYLLVAEPLATEAAQKFALKKQIEECLQKIKQLGG